MWNAGIRRLGQLYPRYACRHYGSWAGDRIITPGEYSQSIPAHALSSIEANVILAIFESFIEGKRRIYSGEPVTSTKQELLALGEGKEAPKRTTTRYGEYIDLDRDMFPMALGLLADLIEVSPDPRMTLALQTDLDESIVAWTKPIESPDFSSTVPWILRNLSKRLYVRADALAHMPNHQLLSPFGIDRVLTLGNVVMYRTTISNEGDHTLKCPPAQGISLTHGEWAGDRFDIVQLTKLDGEIEQWTEVTSEVKAALMSIARYNNIRKF